MVKNCFFLSAFFFAAVSGSPVWADRIADVCTDVDEEKRPELTAARLDALEAAGKAALMSIPENGYDPVAVTMEAMLTPEGLSEWISDATALRPYRGSLRGAKGVLGDRQGNSLDRSLLLTELLTFAGYDARLARARMSGSDLDVLRSKVGKAARLPDFHDVPEEHVRTIGRDERESSVQETACAIALATRIEEQTYQMLRVLAAAGITMNLVPRPSPVALYALMSGRADMNSESLAGLYTRPNIFSFWTRQSPDGKRMTTGFDIVRNEAPAGLDLEAAIRLGVADTVLEGLLLGGLGVESGNASAIFAGNQAAWRVVLSEKDLARAAPPKSIAGLVRTELARGYAIILPGSLTDRLPIAYWRVDPRTGTTLGMTAAGTGGTFSEYGKITNDIAFKVMGMATCLHLVHKFMFGPQTPGYVEAFSVFGCLTPSTKLMQAIAKRNKMTKALSKYYKSKAFRKEVRAYDKIVDGLKKATDEGRASEFIKKLSKTDSKIFDKFQRSKELDFDNVSLLKQFSEKFDPYFSPVKDLFLNIAKNFR